jgi:hypothetical protein
VRGVGGEHSERRSGRQSSIEAASLANLIVEKTGGTVQAKEQQWGISAYGKTLRSLIVFDRQELGREISHSNCGANTSQSRSRCVPGLLGFTQHASGHTPTTIQLLLSSYNNYIRRVTATLIP